MIIYYNNSLESLFEVSINFNFYSNKQKMYLNVFDFLSSWIMQSLLCVVCVSLSPASCLVLKDCKTTLWVDFCCDVWRWTFEFAFCQQDLS